MIFRSGRSVLTTILTAALILLSFSLSLAQTDLAYTIQIERDTGRTGDGVLQGQEARVDINLLETGAPLARFLIVISYPKAALNFTGLSLENSVLINQCGWDQIVAQELDIEDSSSDCPRGYIAIYGTADIGYDDSDDDACVATGAMFSLRFLLANDRTLECQFLPVRFAFVNCRSNLLWVKGGGPVWSEGPVEDPWGRGEGSLCGDPAGPIEPEAVFPTEIAYPGPCTDSASHPSNAAVRLINGGVQVICAGEIDGRGDINLDGLPYTLIDQVLFERYLIYGDSVLHFPPGGEEYYQQRLFDVADINNDGNAFTVADYVQLLRVLDGGPYPAFDQPTTRIRYRLGADNTLVVDRPIGGAYVVLDGDARFDIFDENAAIRSHYREDEDLTYVLVYAGEETQPLTGSVLWSSAPVKSVDLSTVEGNPTVAVNDNLLPLRFVLPQNYPNPFNPTTTIELILPVRSDYTLTIYNTQGQEVETRQGRAEAGVTRIEWDGSDYASGVYFYKVEALGYEQTRKMLLVR